MSNETKQAQLYQVSGFLNKPQTLGGFAYDECLPAFGLVALFTMFLTQPLFGMVAGVVWMFTLRKMKKNRGTQYLLCVLYWYGTKTTSQFIFPKTLPSDQRFWLN